MRTRATVLQMSPSKLRRTKSTSPTNYHTPLTPIHTKIWKKVVIVRDYQNRKLLKNIEKTYLSAPMNPNNTMPMECVRIVTTLRAEPRKHLLVSTVIDLCMPRVCARTATLASTTDRKDPPRSKTQMYQAQQLLKAFEQRLYWSLILSDVVDRC